jgi:hypothetical protein
VFEHLGHQLPILTRALIALAAFVQSFGAIVLVGMIALAIAARSALRREAVATRWHASCCGCRCSVACCRAADTAKRDQDAGDAVGQRRAAARCAPFRRAHRAHGPPCAQALAGAAVRVREGQGFARALAESGQFPPVALRPDRERREERAASTSCSRPPRRHERREVETRLRTIGSGHRPARDPVRGRHGAADRARDPAADLPTFELVDQIACTTRTPARAPGAHATSAT